MRQSFKHTERGRSDFHKRLSTRTQNSDGAFLTCPDYFAHLRPPSRYALNTPEGDRTLVAKLALAAGPLATLGGLYGAVYSVMMGRSYEVALGGLGGDRKMVPLIAACFCIAFVLISVVAEQLRLALRPGGELELLFAGGNMLQRQSVEKLETWQRLMHRLIVFWRTAGPGLTIGGILLSVIGPFTRYHIGFGSIWYATLGPVAGLGFPLVLEFLISIEVAQALATEKTMQVVQAATHTKPDDPEGAWVTNVQDPALALQDGDIGLLSVGWGFGLAAVYGIFWAGLAPAMFFFTLTIVAGSSYIWAYAGITSFLTLGCLVMPLWLSTGVAAASLASDDVLRQLNFVRMCDVKYHAPVLALETSLKNLNMGQGLGFLIGITVLDKAMLKNMMKGIIGVFSTALPVALALFAATLQSHSAIFTEAPATGVLEFDGTNAYSFPDSILPLDANGNAFAFGGWVLLDPVGSSRQDFQMIFDFGSVPGGTDNILLRVMGSDGSMQYRAYVEEDTGTIRSDENFPLHEWVHVAIIHADDVATMYWNGVSVATGPAPVPREVVRTNYVGMGTWPSHRPLLPGSRMQSLSWYNKAVTISDLLYNNGSEPALITAWQLPMEPSRDTGPDGWLALDPSQAAEGSQSLLVVNAFDHNASSVITTCDDNILDTPASEHWIEYAFSSPVTIDRYYLMAPECPTQWMFQGKRCEYARASLLEPYQPNCEWITLDSQEEASCMNDKDASIFRFHPPNAAGVAPVAPESFERYRWQFNEAVTISELGLGGTAEQQQQQQQQQTDGGRGRRLTEPTVELQLAQQQQHEQQERKHAAEMKEMTDSMKEMLRNHAAEMKEMTDSRKDEMRELKGLLQQILTDN